MTHIVGATGGRHSGQGMRSAAGGQAGKAFDEVVELVAIHDAPPFAPGWLDAVTALQVIGAWNGGTGRTTHVAQWAAECLVRLLAALVGLRAAANFQCLAIDDDNLGVVTANREILQAAASGRTRIAAVGEVLVATWLELARVAGDLFG
jgi:hypothetical protein